MNGVSMEAESKDDKILIVDDEEHVRELLSRWVSDAGYNCVQVSSGEKAWHRLQDGAFSLLITDIMMPGMSGMTLLSSVRKRFPDVAVIMVTAISDRETAIQALQLGAYGYIIKPFDQNEVLISVVNALERRKLVLEGKHHERRLEKEVHDRTLDVRRREAEIILRLISASEYRDDETGAHIRRIGLYSAVLAEAAGWKPEDSEIIRLAGAMHDIGKIGVPDNILLKPAKLTAEEFEVVKRHSEIGARILGGSDIPLLCTASDIALSHHEKWDGSGYPQGLAGEAIPECSRIVALADVFDALSSHRVYRPAMPEMEAVAIMRKEKREHFDPRLFELFLFVLPEFRRIQSMQHYIELEATVAAETRGHRRGANAHSFSPRVMETSARMEADE